MIVESTYGPVTLDAQAIDAIRVYTSDDQVLTINGTGHTVNTMYYRNSDGEWRPERENSRERYVRIHLSRVDSWDDRARKFLDPSESAVRRARLELSRVCKSMPEDALVEAENARTAAAIAEREAAIAAARDHIRALQHEVRALKHGGRVEHRTIDERNGRSIEHAVIVTARGRILRTRSAEYSVR